MNVHVWLLRKFRKIRKWILKIEIQLFMNRKPTKKKRKEAFSSSSETPKLIIRPNLAWTRIYGIACWVKYLVDSSENIWGCLDESIVVVAHHEPAHAFEPEMECLWHDPRDPNRGPVALPIRVRELRGVAGDHHRRKTQILLFLCLLLLHLISLVIFRLILLHRLV